MKTSPDVVKRWVNEAQEAVNSDNMMVQVSIFALCSKLFLILCYTLKKYFIHPVIYFHAYSSCTVAANILKFKMLLKHKLLFAMLCCIPALLVNRDVI